MIWLYIALAFIAAAGAFLVGRLVKDRAAKRRIGVWVCIAAGACFTLIYALEPDHDLFILAIGLTCWITGVLAFLPESRRGTDPGRQS